MSKHEFSKPGHESLGIPEKYGAHVRQEWHNGTHNGIAILFIVREELDEEICCYGIYSQNGLGRTLVFVVTHPSEIRHCHLGQKESPSCC